MSSGDKSRRDWTWLGVVILLGLLLFQAFAYTYRLDLSLGPRVIFQPWAMHNGSLIYENLADQHSPLMPLLMSALRPLGADGLRLARIVLVALITLTTLLGFLAARRHAGWPAGVVAAFVFVIWSPTFGFIKLWHETFLAPLYLIWLWRYDPTAPRRSTRQLILLGLLGGIAVMVKQQAAVVFAAFVLWNALTIRLARRSRTEIWRETGWLCLAAVVPVAAMAGYHYAQAGTLANFFYWTITFNLVSGYRTLAAVAATPAHWSVLASAGLLLPAVIFLMVALKRKKDPAWLSLGWGLVLLVSSSLTAYPRFEFFHLQPALPVLAWLSALVLAYAGHRHDNALQPARAWFPAGVVVGIAVLWLVTAGSMYRVALRSDAPRRTDEYTDLVPLSSEIRQRIGPTDRFYIFPDDEATANLYYLAQCPPPRFWVFTYPWYMLDSVKRRVLGTLRTSPPEWIVYFPGRWGIEQRAPEIIAYMEKYYSRDTALHWEQGDAWLFKRAAESPEERKRRRSKST
jgi:hypothetical protein